MKKLPMGAGSAELVSVKYPAEAGGFTPGDTWNLYVGKDNRVEYLVFHHGGDREAQPGQSILGRLQKGRSSADLNRAPRHGRRQAAAHLHYGSGS